MDIYVVGGSKYLKISWERLEELVERLADKIRRDYEFDVLVGVLRGGMIVAHLISDILGVDEIYPIGCISYVDIYKRSTTRVYHPLIIEDLKNMRVLLVDDVADSGNTLKTILENEVLPKNPKECRTATLHIKPWSKFQPNYYVEVTDAWIVYPWEKFEIIRLLGPRFIQHLGEKEGINYLAELVDKKLEKIKEILTPTEPSLKR